MRDGLHVEFCIAVNSRACKQEAGGRQYYCRGNGDDDLTRHINLRGLTTLSGVRVANGCGRVVPAQSQEGSAGPSRGLQIPRDTPTQNSECDSGASAIRRRTLRVAMISPCYRAERIRLTRYHLISELGN
jgi:hypothetical protein